MELECYAIGIETFLQKIAQAYRVMTNTTPHFICPHSESFFIIRELFSLYKSKMIELSLVKQDAFDKEIRPNTALILMSRYNPYTGCPNPISEIYKIAQEHKIPLHVDFGSTQIDMKCCNSCTGSFPFLFIERRLRKGYCLEQFGNSFLNPIKKALPKQKPNSAAKIVASEMLKKKVVWQVVPKAVLDTDHGNTLIIMGPDTATLNFQSPVPKNIGIQTELQFPLTEDFLFRPVSFLDQQGMRLIQLEFRAPLSNKDIQQLIKAMKS